MQDIKQTVGVIPGGVGKNLVQDIKQQEEMLKRFDEKFPHKIAEVIDDFGSTCKQDLKSFIQSEISLAVEQEKERVLATVLKEIGEMRKSAENVRIIQNEPQSNQYIHLCDHLDTLKNKLKAKQ